MFYMNSRIALGLVIATCFWEPLAGLAQTKTTQPRKVAPQRSVAVPRASQAASLQRQPGNPQLGVYLNKLSSKAYRNWYLPDGSNHVSISTEVQPDGTSANIQAT